MFTSSDDIKSNMEIILRCNFEAHFLEEKRWWSKPIRQKLIFWGKHGGMVILNGTRSRGVQSSTARLWYKSCWKLWDYDSSLGDLWVLSGCEKQMQPMKTTSGETSPPSLEDLTKSYHQYHQYNIIYIYINMICICICSCNCTHIMDHFFPTTFYFSWWSIYLPKNQKTKTSKFPDVPSWEHVPGVSAALLPPPGGANLQLNHSQVEGEVEGKGAYVLQHPGHTDGGWWWSQGINGILCRGAGSKLVNGVVSRCALSSAQYSIVNRDHLHTYL